MKNFVKAIWNYMFHADHSQSGISQIRKYMGED